jgi:hypothetical protein
MYRIKNKVTVSNGREESLIGGLMLNESMIFNMGLCRFLDSSSEDRIVRLLYRAFFCLVTLDQPIVASLFLHPKASFSFYVVV